MLIIFQKLTINHFLENEYTNLINLKYKIFFNKSLIIQEKKKILSLFSKELNKNLTFINTLFYFLNINFGNFLCSLNKLIFFCEILGCKKIFLDKDIFWLIKNKIKIKNITLDIFDKKKYKNSTGIYYNSYNLYYSFFNIKPEIRINFLRLEIINNLPKIKSNEKFLFIHIRSGDIFIDVLSEKYSQPPLCFYQKIINNYNFEKIYIISSDNLNPVINKLINLYPNIIFTRNSIKKDISFLINAYNIVASISSFLISIISLNYNLKYIWDYNIYKLGEKYYHFHYDIYKFPHNNFKVLRMNPSSKYREIMFKWKNSFYKLFK